MTAILQDVKWQLTVESHIFNFCKLNLDRFQSTLLSSVQLLSCVQLFATPWTAACKSSLSITNSQSLLKLISIESVMPYNHLIFCCPHLLLLSIFPSIRVFSNESVFCIRWPKYQSFISSSVLPMNIQDCLVTKSFLTLCDPMDCSMPGFPVLHSLLELAQTHVHWVSDGDAF